MKNFSKNLKQARKKAKFTQKAVAQYLGVVESAYANWEQGRSEPSIDNIKLLSRLYNIPITTLLDEPKTAFSKEETDMQNALKQKLDNMSDKEFIDYYEKTFESKVGMNMETYVKNNSNILSYVEDAFGKKLRTIRTEKGLSKKDILNKTNISINDLDDFERGFAEPSLLELKALAKALDVDVNILLEHKN